MGGGTFDFSGLKTRLIDGPKSTADMLSALSQTFQASVAAGETPERTIDRISEIDPRFKRYRSAAINAVAALGVLFTIANNLKGAYDIYDALSGNKAAQEKANLDEAAARGAALALEKFYGTLEFKELQERLAQESPKALPQANPTGNGAPSNARRVPDNRAQAHEK